MTRRTRQALLIALPVLLVTLMGFGALFATADGAATVFLPLVVRSPAVEEPRDVMPAEVRAAVVNDIADFIENLPHEDFEAETAQILARLRAHPEIETAVADDTGGMIWATFSDGVTLYIFDEEHAPPSEDPTAQRALSPASSPPGTAGPVPAAAPEILPPAMPGSSAPAVGPPSGIPNLWYRLLDGLGPGYRSTNPIPDIQAMLDEAGYRGFAGEASLTALRHVGNDGVFYLRTHGLPGNEETGRPAAFSTSTLYKGEFETDLIAADYAYGRLGLMLIRYRWYRRRPEPAYAITDAFIDRYWNNFADNSLVYFDACHGITLDAIIDVLRQKNASVIMGWNGRLRPGPAQDTSRFVFDRLLGANVFQSEDPSQRPFDYVSVFDAHIGPARDHGHCPVEGSTLEFRTGPGSFGLLAPSIKRMEIREGPEELIIHGLFGPDPAPQPREVTVQGEPLIVDTWDPHEIRVAGFTADKEGEVVVTVMDRESNAVPITSWRDWEVRGTVWWVGWISPLIEVIDNETVELVWALDIRADVHSYREAPGAEPVKPEIDFWQAARSSSFRWDHSAYHNYHPHVGESGSCRIKGGGSLDWYDLEHEEWFWVYFPDLDEGQFGSWGSLNTEAERMTVWAPYYRPGAEETCTYRDGRTFDPVWGGAQFFHIDETIGIFPVEVTFGSESYDIEQGHKPALPELVGPWDAELHWQPVQAQHAP